MLASTPYWSSSFEINMEASGIGRYYTRSSLSASLQSFISVTSNLFIWITGGSSGLIELSTFAFFGSFNSILPKRNINNDVLYFEFCTWYNTGKIKLWILVYLISVVCGLKFEGIGHFFKPRFECCF